MTRNEGTLDRGLRGILGIVLAVLFLTGLVAGWLGWVLLIAGAVLLVTAVTGFCPLYALFGVRTCPVPARRS